MIDKRNPLPFYAQVKDLIYAGIREGKWQRGQQLPGEHELCDQFGVSRTVIRQALAELTYEGVLRKERGRGTFIAEAKVRGSLVQRLTGFFQDMTEQGYQPTSIVLRLEKMAATANLVTSLHLEPSAAVILIERLRFIKDEPLVLVATYVPYDLCPGLLGADLTQQSLYVYLEHEYGLKLAYGRRSITAIAASEHDAKLLNVKKGAPLIQLDSVGYQADGTPLECYHALHRADRTQFEVELVNSADQTVKPHGFVTPSTSVTGSLR